jgi:hypothetical protein
MDFQVSEHEVIMKMFRHKKRYCKRKLKETEDPEDRQILLGYSSTGYGGMGM